VSRRSFRDQLREHPILLAFAAAYLVGWTIYGLAIGAPATVAYLASVTLVIGLVIWLDQRVGFSSWILWALAAWGFAHMAGGLVPFGDGVLYNAGLGDTVVHYDRVVHAFGFGVAAIACWEALVAINPTVTLTPGTAVLVALMGMGVGAANEVVEFAASHLFASNVGGYENTGWDLVANLLGCTVASTLLYLNRARAGVSSVVGSVP
jgi:putative membrane protein